MSTSTTTTPAAAPRAPSTRPPAVLVGDTVLVRLGPDTLRPMMVSSVDSIPVFDRDTPTADNPGDKPVRQELRVSGMIVCQPDDHTLPALRGALDRPRDPARIHGRPERLAPYAFGEYLAQGSGIGQWAQRGK